MDTTRTVRAAAVQLSPVLFSRDGSTEKVIAAIEDAGRKGVQLAVFPETFIPNYPYFATWRPPATIMEQHVLLYEESVDIPGPVTDAVGGAAWAFGRQQAIRVTPRPSHDDLQNATNYRPVGGGHLRQKVATQPLRHLGSSSPTTPQKMRGSIMSTTVRSTTTINGCRTTHIYCLPGCPAGRRTKPENRVHFQSREDAIARGYRACKVCKPDGPHPEIETLLVQHYSGPLGTCLIIASQRGIVCVEPEDQIGARLARWEKAGIRLEPGRNQHSETMARELDAYFRGGLQQFNAPVDLRGTPFQRQVWEALCRIPYGKTLTYGELACSIGHPGAARAVGHAIASNPVSIAVPCHRVVGSNGSLTGYGGGLHRKDALLRLEGSLPHSNKQDR